MSGRSSPLSQSAEVRCPVLMNANESLSDAGESMAADTASPFRKVRLKRDATDGTVWLPRHRLHL